MSEFALIKRYFQAVGPRHKDTCLAIGDDAAVINLSSEQQLAMSIDTMNEGVHFAPKTAASDVAHKLMAVNLSDLAAVGAVPKWAMLSISLPVANDDWLGRFADSLKELASKYAVELVGGDTTRGPLSASLAVFGTLSGSPMTRSGARSNDNVYVADVTGDAALGLKLEQGELGAFTAAISAREKQQLLQKLRRPEAQVDLGQQLREVVTACIDVSDGLVADLTHIAESSSIGIEVDTSLLPLSPIYRQYMRAGGKLDLALNGGDDYVLVFTAARESDEQIQELASKCNIKITRIGRCSALIDALQLYRDGSKIDLPDNNGYDHFAEVPDNAK